MDFEGLNYVTPKLARKNLSAIKENENRYQMMGYTTPPTKRRAATNLSRRASSESFSSNASSMIGES